MKKIIIIVALAAVTLVQTSFAQDTSNLPMQKVIGDYLDVKRSLTKDNADSASVYAKNLSEDLQKVPMEKFSEDQHKIWMQLYDALEDGAAAIGKSVNLKNQRKQFADLSSHFYKILKSLNFNTVELFYQYCPMADAYWISENSKIVNPYYGKQMPSCGSTKETLKAK